MKTLKGFLAATLTAFVIFAMVGRYDALHPVLHAQTFGPIVGGDTWLNAQTALNATHTPTGSGMMSRCRESAVYIVWSTGVTSGAVTVESAHDAAYTGTWASEAVVTFSGTAPKQDIVQITGIHAALRSRISTVVAGSGGSVSSYIHCN